MFFGSNFPYTNFHDLNLDWLLQRMQELNSEFAAFAETNKIHYADPFEWSIANNYEAMTLVRDPDTNYIYLSTQPVPVGIALSNTDYWIQVGDMNAFAGQIDALDTKIDTVESTLTAALNAKIGQLNPTCNIAILGDSTFKDSYVETWLPAVFKNATVTNYYDSSYAKWTTLMGQVRAISGTPDLIFINCGSNDVSPNSIAYDHGGQMGAPDVVSRTVPSGATTTFEAMREVLGTLRDAYPEALIFGLIRAEHPNRNKAVWHYLTYFESLIYYNWGVPVIDLNEVINFTAWNDAQKAVYAESDGQHYTEALIKRMVQRFGTLANSGNPSGAGFQAPSVYFVPASVIDQTEARNSLKNRLLAAHWAALHCQPLAAGENGGALSGLVYAYSGLGATVANFKSWSYLPYDSSSATIQLVIREGSRTYSAAGDYNGIEQAESYLLTHVITADNTSKWYQLPDGDYTVRGSGVSTLGLPSDISEANLIMRVRSNPVAALDNTGDLYKYAFIEMTTVNYCYKGSRLLSTSAENWWSLSMTAI